MTQTPDDRYPEEPQGSSGPEGARKLDEDALWAEIVANYGDRPAMGSGRPVEPVETPDPVEPSDRPVEPRRPVEGPGRPVEPVETDDPGSPSRRPRGLFDRSFIESTTERSRELNTPGSWENEGHFVPPAPPPVPLPEPRRRMAWIGLFGAPALMLLGIVLGWAFPSWVSALLVSAFVGGFVYLVATMPRDGRGHWPDDDGAVV